MKGGAEYETGGLGSSLVCIDVRRCLAGNLLFLLLCFSPLQKQQLQWN